MAQRRPDARVMYAELLKKAKAELDAYIHQLACSGAGADQELLRLYGIYFELLDALEDPDDAKMRTLH